MSDTVFELRRLTKSVNISANLLDGNIETHILNELRRKYEGKCSEEGYLRTDSIRVVNRSLGRLNYINGGIDYDVEFEVDICFPHIGQVFLAKAVSINKLGITCVLSPMKIQLFRDFFIGDPLFEAVTLGEMINVEIIGKPDFKHNSGEICVAGKIHTRENQTPEQSITHELIEPVITVNETPVEDTIRTVITAELPTRKTRKLKLKDNS
jgi:DNA-directed RNA polymerase subunit E'/Rpb7